MTVLAMFVIFVLVAIEIGNDDTFSDPGLEICAGFDDDYWLEHDQSGEFPAEFYDAVADGGWLGIAMPEQYGGAGLGVTDAALMMHAVGGSAGAMSAADSR